MMITLKDAVRIMNTEVRPKGSSITFCLEFADFYLFSFADENQLTGTVFPAINKETGKIFVYDITSDAKALYHANDVTDYARR